MSICLLSSSASGAIELGDTQLTISRAQPRVEVSTSVRVFGRDQGFKIRTRYVLVMLLSVMILLAVGADYNLLLVSRFKEEIHAGLRTGIIRAMAGTGGVVTAAGLVFAFTMASFVYSDLVVLGQIGTTIALGLLFDTLIVRSFMTPSIAALLGRWFWWPQRVRPRPASQVDELLES